MLNLIKKYGDEFKNILQKTDFVNIIVHFDTDGITSAAILTKALQKEDKKFRVRIVKQLSNEVIKEIENEKIVLFLDLGSSFLKELEKVKGDVFVLDHHELAGDIKDMKNMRDGANLPSKIRLVNPHLFDEEDISGAGLAYLFVRSLQGPSAELADLAIVGMVGDMLEQNLSKLNNLILRDTDNITIKKSLLIFSATRPLQKALEFSSDFFIPSVTGSSYGVSQLLREANIKSIEGKGYRTLLDLNEEEVSRLITAILLRSGDKKGIIGNIYLLKFFDHLEDVRELSTLINACSRLGHPDISLALCLGSSKAKTKAERIYNTYKHSLIGALKWVSNTKKIEGKRFVIINAKDKIRDTIIGTIMSILAKSFLYAEGTIIIGMAYANDNSYNNKNNEKIKVSARVVGKSDVNLKLLLEKACKNMGETEYGGHAKAAGCSLPKSKEQEFIENLRKELETESIKIKIR